MYLQTGSIYKSIAGNEGKRVGNLLENTLTLFLQWQGFYGGAALSIQSAQEILQESQSENVVIIRWYTLPVSCRSFKVAVPSDASPIVRLERRLQSMHSILAASAASTCWRSPATSFRSNWLVVLSSQFAPYFDFKFVLCFFVGRGFCR
jgi:hypothetical protein